MQIHGHSIVGGRAVPGTGATFTGLDAATGRALDPAFTSFAADQVALATAAAAEAAPAYAATSPAERAAFLDAVAEAIEGLGDALLERAGAESGLPAARLTGERGRTCGQLRMFAEVARRGDHLGVRIDPALPERAPLPRPDLRVRNVPLGPVAVFGASNFPLAFSTAGGDTASALAAGCPVVVKAHPAHPGTAELVAWAVVEAAERTGMPPGVFGLVVGPGTDVGQALVADPRIRAVGFTGSRAGGLALVAAAAARPTPVPVYAEMSSVNPVVVCEGALADPSLASQYVASLTLGAGQFCTNPGLTFVPAGPAGDRFVAAVGDEVGAASGQVMLTSAIREAFTEGEARLGEHADVEVVGRGTAADNAPPPAVHVTDLATFAAEPALAHEVFGAAGLVVRWSDVDALAQTLGSLEGQLTTTIHAAPGDHGTAATLLPHLEAISGRVVFNGWPTGVEVTHAMVHGGPFPATSSPGTTSVGSLAIERFQRPVCYQDLPADLQPEALRDDNPWGLGRLVAGEPGR